MRLFLFFLFFAISQLVTGQRFSFIQYGTKQGLPQSQVNSIVQGKDGYIWVGTFGGLARFNGDEFSSYSRDKGLLNNRITKLKIINHQLFVGHSQGVSVQISTNRFYAIPYPDKNKMENVSDFISLNDNIYVTTNGGGIFQLDTISRQLKHIKDSPERIRSTVVYRQQIYLATRSGIYSFDGSHFNSLKNTREISFSGIAINKGKMYATSYNGVLYHVNITPEKLSPIFKSKSHRFRQLLIDNNDNFWLNSKSGVVLLKENDTLIFTEKTGLPINDINIVFEDLEENIWIGANGKGLLRFTDEVFTHFNTDSGFPSDIIIALHIDQQKNIWISTLDKGVFKIESTGEVIPIDYIPSTVWTISGNKNNVLFGANYGLFCYHQSKFKSFYTEDGLPSDNIKGIIPINNSSFIVSTEKGSVFFDPHSLPILTSDSILQKIKGARDFVVQKDTYYAASQTILYTKTDQNKVETERFDAGINCIESDAHNKLWIGTENGLIIRDHDSTYRYSLQEEGGPEYINFIQKYDSLLFIGTNNGLYEVGDQFNFKYHYGINSGLIDLETNLNSNFLQDNRYLWFGTASGLTRMDLKKRKLLLKNIQPKIHLIGLNINTTKLSNQRTSSFNSASKQLKIPYKDNNITLKFDGIFMTDPEGIKYSYYLDGFSNDWTIPSKSSIASFTNLPPGEYTFKMKAISGASISSDYFILPIKIYPPFYRTWWFYTVITVLTILILIGLDQLRLKRIGRKNHQIKLELKNKLSQLEQQSLNASMNRHFIFNALNSIQYYINASDKKSANRYLSRFAKLIRKNLDSSYRKDGMVGLSDEIERLQLYLGLEIMRFKDRFDFEINIDKTVEIDALKVPGMFLQPFVENSIIHGLLPLKDRKGKLIISITDHLDHIRIEIKDNGVGIDESKAKKVLENADHQSQGMLITKGRIELLQKVSARSIEMIGPHQIKENNTLINGTVVTFKIMKQYLEDWNK